MGRKEIDEGDNPEHLRTEPDALTTVGDEIWLGDHIQVKGGCETAMICTKKVVKVTRIDRSEIPWLYSTKCEGCESAPGYMLDPNGAS